MELGHIKGCQFFFYIPPKYHIFSVSLEFEDTDHKLQVLQLTFISEEFSLFTVLSHQPQHVLLKNIKKSEPHGSQWSCKYY